MPIRNESRGTALITGASSGIGAIYADRLARRGYDLILVGRDESRLRDVAKSVEGNGLVVIMPADLTDEADLTHIEAILRTDPAITMLVNNAGIGSVAPLIDAEVAKMHEIIALNIGALTRLSYAAAPQFAARGSGTVINISSIVAIGPEIMNGVYGASKAYVLALTQSMHHELASKGVRIQAVLPGATATEFWNTAGMPHSNLPASMVMAAADMVDAAMAGFDLGEIVTIPPLHDGDVWTAYEASRQAMVQLFANAQPAARYETVLTEAA
jgi:short-subunit dehydrogenase